jgi:hypothetical protein
VTGDGVIVVLMQGGGWGLAGALVLTVLTVALVMASESQNKHPSTRVILVHR